MTKKDYIIIAETLRKTKTSVEVSGIGACFILFEQICNNFCDILILDNPKFDSKKFKKACGLID